MKKNLKPATLCVQAGWMPKNGESRVLPIIQSTTFKYDNSEEMAMLFDLKKEGYFYTRLQNPTNDAVANKIAALEGGIGAVLTSSGQAANLYAVFKKRYRKHSNRTPRCYSAKQFQIPAAMCLILRNSRELLIETVCL